MVAYFYPPLAGGGVHRALSFTRHLPEHGWDCTVVCAGPRDYWVSDPSLEARIPPGTEVIRVSGGSALAAWLGVRGGDRGRRSGADYAWLRRLSDWWLLPDSYVGWSARATRAALTRARAGGIDAVLTSSPPDSVHLAGLRLARATGLPWVADFRDPWMGLWFREPPTRWHRARQAAFERRVLEGSDLVLTASATHAERVGERSGAQPRALQHLPNGFEPWSGDAAPNPDQFVLVFSGTLSLMPDVELLLDALHEMLAATPEARRRLRVRLVGPYDSGYEDRSIALGLKGIVEFTGPRSHAETRALQHAADLLLLWKPRGAPTMVPGKLYEYLDSGRPILALLPAEDEAARLVERAGGARLEPGDRGALARALESRYRAWRTEGRIPDARPEWIEDWTRARLAARLAERLDQTVAARRAGGDTT